MSATHDNSLVIGTLQRIIAGYVTIDVLMSRNEDYLVTSVLGSAAGLTCAIALGREALPTTK